VPGRTNAAHDLDAHFDALAEFSTERHQGAVLGEGGGDVPPVSSASGFESQYCDLKVSNSSGVSFEGEVSGEIVGIALTCSFSRLADAAIQASQV